MFESRKRDEKRIGIDVDYTKTEFKLKQSYLSGHYGMSQQYHFGATFLCFVTALTISKYSGTDDDDIQNT